MKHHRIWQLLLALLVAGSSGCRSAHSLQQADVEVYSILDAKETTLGREPGGLRLEAPDPAAEKAQKAAIVEARKGKGRRLLSLATTLQTAAEHSREYRSRREDLFLSALALSGERHRYAVTPGANLSATYEHEADGDERGRARSNLGVTKLFRGGATLGVKLLNNFLQYYTGDPRRSASSLVSATFVQPFWRGAGVEIAAENLTQAERNVVYAIRSFDRFKRTFAVDIAKLYYRLLQRRDVVVNEYNNYQNLIRSRQRAEALAGDRLGELQVDQARQDELRARNRYIVSVERYRGELDSLKLSLGLPLGETIILNDQALADLMEEGLTQVHTDRERGFDHAVERRQDLLNEFDRLEDARRRTKVAANQMKADFNIFADASLGSTPATRLERFNADKAKFSLGARLDLPLDRLDERNAYRRSLIDFERQMRATGLALDQVKDAIRGGLRALAQARKQYYIQKNAVALAKRRVASFEDLQLAGRAEVRDMLEAQDALVSTRNALTQSLVDYHLARLDLLRDLGALVVGTDGFSDALPAAPDAAAEEAPEDDKVVTPEELFGN